MTQREPALLYYHLHEDVVAFSTTRQGGFSTGNYAEFNINRFCGDDENSIRKNRSILCQLLDITDERLIMPHQVHLTKTYQIDEAFLACSAEERLQRLEGIDAVMTSVKGICIGVSTADCIPLLVYDRQRHIAAAIHAGWRGTVQRIAEQTIIDMKAAYGSEAEDLCVQIGPGISLDSFEVGDEVYEAFVDSGFNMDNISHHNGKWHIDLLECNRQQLIAAGVPPTGISIANICTVKRSETFFSARRLGIQSGRIFSGIMILRKEPCPHCRHQAVAVEPPRN